MGFKLEIDTGPLDKIVINAFQIHGEAILFGIPEPAPMHTGGKVSTAFTLAVVEFGPGLRRSNRMAPKPAKGSGKRPGFLTRVSAKVCGLLGRVRQGRPTPKGATLVKPPPPTDKRGERPVIRWVAATQHGPMADGFKAAARQAMWGRDPRPDLEVLGRRLADLTRERLAAVGGVDTGQTRDAITHKIERRWAR